MKGAILFDFFKIFGAGTPAAKSTDKPFSVPTIAVAVTVPVILVALVAVGVGLFLKR